MKKHLVNVRLVIETQSRNNAFQNADIEGLLAELKMRGYMSGFWSDIEREYEYECEECHHVHGNKESVYKCSVCGKEVCDWCDFKQEGEAPLCEECADEKDMMQEVVNELNAT